MAMAAHRALMPGAQMPRLSVPRVGGGSLDTAAPGRTRPAIIILYRGAWCPFCKENLLDVNRHVAAAADAGMDVMALSADNQETAEGFVKELSLSFPVGYGLTEPQMHQLGVYVSDPTNYIPQKQRFSEPAAFVVNPDGSIKYMDIASAPMLGRVNVPAIISGYTWSLQNAKEHPEFQKVVWGSVPAPSG